jgi:hypothetical protein
MKIAKTIVKILAWLVAGLVVLAVVVYLFALAVNWNDQPPSAAATRLEQIPRERPPVADADNGYVYLAGFSVAPEEDPRVWGARRVAWAHKVLAQPPAAPVVGFPGEEHDFKLGRSDAVRGLSEACASVAARCLAALESGDAEIAEWLRKEGWLLERYKTLLAHPGWREPVPWDERVPLPHYVQIHEGQKLLLAEAWTLAERGDAVGVQRLLDADVRFWRHALAEADNLIPKLVAAAALRRHFAWSNLVLRRLPREAVGRAVPQLWKEPLSDAERSMLRSVAGEWAFFDRSIRRAAEVNGLPIESEDEATVAQRVFWRMANALFQVQDTSNQQAALLASVAEVLEVPYMQYPQALKRARVIQHDAAEAAFPPHGVYNVVGDILFAIGASSNLTSYAARVADLEGVRRVALLAVELRTGGVPPAQVPQMLADPSLRSPYGGEPFAWDEREQAIVFVGLERDDRGRHAIPY